MNCTYPIACYEMYIICYALLIDISFLDKWLTLSSYTQTYEMRKAVL